MIVESVVAEASAWEVTVRGWQTILWVWFQVFVEVTVPSGSGSPTCFTDGEAEAVAALTAGSAIDTKEVDSRSSRIGRESGFGTGLFLFRASAPQGS